MTRGRSPVAVAIGASILVWALVAGAARSAALPGRWTTAGLEGGFVEAVAVNPSRPDEVMAGTRRGVFVSQDAGAHWAPASNGLTQLNVRDVTFDRDRPEVAYAGTTRGLFKTTNGGVLWVPVKPRIDALDVEVTHGEQGRVVVNETWALTASGDGGLTWDTLYHDRLHQLMGFAVAPSDPDVIYLSVYDHETATGLVRRSGNGGRSWTTVTTGMRPGSLSVDPDDPSVVLATDDGRVVRSTDGGQSWRDLPPAVNGNVVTLARAPSAPGTVYGLGQHHDEGMFVVRSDDRGETWVHAGDVGEYRYPTVPAVSPADPATLYIGSFGNGLLKSTDGGSSFVHVNRGLSAAPARDIAIDPANPLLAYAVTGFRGVFRSDDGGTTWRDVMSGFDDPEHRFSPGAGAVAVDAASHVYATRYLVEGPDGFAVFRSEDGGETWAARGAPEPGATILLPHPGRAGELLAGTTRGVYATTDGGATWMPSGPIDQRIEDVVSGGGDTVYVATGDDHYGNGDASRLYVSHDFGATWDRLRYPPFRHVISLAVRRDPHVLYAGSGVSSQLALSLDGGTTWTAHYVDPTNNASAVSAIAPDPVDPTQVLAGTEMGGLWLSRTGGTTWLPTTPGIYGDQIFDIVFTPLAVDLPVDVPLLRSRPAFAGATSPGRTGVSRIVLEPHAFRRPSLRGELSTGSTVTCARGRWSRAKSFRYAWVVDDATVATGAEYRVRRGDGSITCFVTAKGPGGAGHARTKTRPTG